MDLKKPGFEDSEGKPLTADNQKGKKDDSDNYEAISAEKIHEDMNNFICEVSSIVKISKTITRILLSHFEWDKDKLMEKYYDGDRDKLFAETHIVNPFGENKLEDPLNLTNECQVCFTVAKPSGMTKLSCGHLYCTPCLDDYLTTKITTEGVDSILCAADNCNILIEDDTVMNLLKENTVIAKYLRLILKSYVESNKLLRWCPASDCNHVIKVKSLETKLLKCQCNYTFCFCCGETYDDPTKCDYLLKLKKERQDREEAETLKWLQENTRNCPKCNAVIEKSGGCNKLTCRNVSCYYKFCWVCLEAWTPGHPCDRPDSSENAALEDESYFSSDTESL